jgi:outer membrane murein-binding lipoprotein Lpp
MDNPTDGAQLNEQQDQEVQSQKFEGPEWLASMPDDLKASKTLSKFKDVENLARGYENAQKLIGRDRITIPKTDEEFQEAYAKLGCPDDPKKYAFKYDDSKLSDAHKGALAKDVEMFRGWAKAAGLNNAQANMVINKYAEQAGIYAAEDLAKCTAETQACESALRSEWGEAYDLKITIANRVLSRYGDQNMIQAIVDSGLGRNPGFVRMISKLGEMTQEDVGIDKTGGSQVMTPEAIREQIAEVQSHPAYLDASHPEHKMVVDRAQKLFERLVAR